MVKSRFVAGIQGGQGLTEYTNSGRPLEPIRAVVAPDFGPKANPV